MTQAESWFEFFLWVGL